MRTPRNILPKLAGLEGNLEEELARLALLRSQGKLPWNGGKKFGHGSKHTIRMKIDLFRSQVIFSNKGCWEWQGPDSKYGYGCFSIGCQVVRAHRFSFAVFNRRDPEKGICHTCDNPRCVNPGHFFEGTQKQNMIDCAIKGRTHSPKGVKNPTARFTDAQVLKLRKSPLSNYQLAEIWKVAPSTIRRLKAGETWGHLPLK